jgi:hypothetical protein
MPLPTRSAELPVAGRGLLAGAIRDPTAWGAIAFASAWRHPESGSHFPPTELTGRNASPLSGCARDGAGMKTDRIRTDMTDIVFIFIFISGFGFEYG